MYYTRQHTTYYKHPTICCTTQSMNSNENVLEHGINKGNVHDRRINTVCLVGVIDSQASKEHP